MTFSALLLQSFSDSPQQVQDWERLNFDMQVLLAWCDGDLAEEERLGLLLRTQLLDNQAELEARIEMWSQQVAQYGVHHIRDQIFAYYRQLNANIKNPLRQKIADELLLEVLQTVVADRVVNEAEHSFITKDLEKLFNLAPGHAEEQLQNAVQGVIRAVRYAEYAFEIYLLMWELAPDSPPSMDLPEADLEGFPASVRDITERLRLGSSMAVNYILSAIGGVAVVAQVDEFCEHLEALIPSIRNRKAKGQSLPARVASIVSELRSDAHDPSEAVDTVFHHLLQIFGLVSVMPAGVRGIFRDTVLTSFGIDHQVLVEQARALQSANPLLLQNLLVEDSAAVEGQRKWWQIWK